MILLRLGVVVVLLAGCDSSPTEPTRAPATLVQITMAPEISVLLVGRSMQFTSHALYSDGSSRSITPLWSVDAATVATVDAAGLVRALRSGAASITASFEVRSVSRRVRSIVDLSGYWEGPATIIECRAIRDINCETERRLPPTAVTLIVDQVESRVRAYLIAWSLQLFADGTVGDDGALALGGDRLIGTPPYAMMRVSEWTTVLAADGTITGTFVGWREEQGSLEATKRMSFRVDSLRRTRAGPVSFPSRF